MTTWYGDRARAAAERGGAEGKHAAATALLARVLPNVPVDRGELRDSGQVVEDEDGSYVVFDTPYAVAVHENLEARHPRGTAKFLEAELDQFGPELLEALQRALDKALR